MHPGDATGQIEGVRRQTVAFLDQLISKAGEFDLADPPPVLAHHLQKLRQNAYKVLVVGEAKRGKSTFVNALIGRDILPTDVDVATSQVFNIRPSGREAYRVRFEDGSAREISLEDLPLYGSQAMADRGYLPTADRIVRWIEVEVPIKFLPAGVSILDTPGLGALYAGHALITHRFVPEADAVIFVLESGQPVVEDDLKFVEQILTVTRNIFFVQTKIDRHSQADWQSIQRRNEEILEKRFGERLVDARVWPISSTLLRKAAIGDKRAEAYLTVSRHNELMGALQAFLARMSGWGRTAEAMLAAGRYHATSRKVLAGRLAGLTAESEQKQAELQNAAAESKRRFDAEWGMQGHKYRQLRDGLQRAMAVGKQSFANVLQAGSDIELTQKAKIEAVKSLKQANRVAEEMPGEIITTAINRWAEVCEEVQFRCLTLLGPFAEAADTASVPPDPNLPGFATAEDVPDKKFEHDYFMMLRSAMGGGMLAMGATGMASVAGFSLTAALGAAAPFVAIPALVALAGAGIKGALSGQVKAAQQQLRVQLFELLQETRRHFFDVDLTAGAFSRVDEYFMTLERTVNDQVREMVEKKSNESQVEITRLTQAIQLEGHERAIRIRQAQGQLAEWDRIGESGKALMAQITALQRPKAPVTA